jgi:hypothetical protein
VAEVLALGWGVWAFCAAAVFFGTILQRLAGQGFGMIAAPMLAMVAPGYLPATLLLLGLVIGAGAVSVDRSALVRAELIPGFAGRALGAVIAAVIALQVADSGRLALVVAGVVYLGIALSLLGVKVAIRPVSLAIAGCAGGIMGTLTAVGAPPMALLYQHESARRSAAMQNAFYAFGMIVSVAALTLAGLIGWRHLVLALSLAPVSILALLLAGPLARRVARGRIRPVALGLAFLAATVLLLRQLL